MKLFMLLLGCKPKERYTEQHDIFFGFGDTLKDLVPDIIDSWPEAEGNLHIDAWREVTYVNGHTVTIHNKTEHIAANTGEMNKLFFINLGGYRQNEFDEYHYKMLVACGEKSIAIQNAKATAFYKHTGFTGAPSHVDDKYGIDVDDVYEIEDILPEHIKAYYQIKLLPSAGHIEDEIHLGYFILDKL